VKVRIGVRVGVKVRVRVLIPSIDCLLTCDCLITSGLNRANAPNTVLPSISKELSSVARTVRII